MTEREQLRERLATLLPWGKSGSELFCDAILAEIEAAGYVLLERGRAKQLIENAGIVAAWFPVLQDAGVRPPDLDKRLHPGDLDLPDGGE